MQDILETKHKVMQEKIQKLIDTIYFCYIEQEKEQQNLLNIMQTIQKKYEQSYEKIRIYKNIKPSLKYKQLEEIIMQQISKIEVELAKNTNQHTKEEIEQLVSKKYKEIEQTPDMEKALQDLEKAKNTYSYFQSYLGKKVLEEYYIKSKFNLYMKKSKIDLLQKNDFNAFRKIDNQNELSLLEDYIEDRIMEQRQTFFELNSIKIDKKIALIQRIEKIIDARIKHKNKKIKLHNYIGKKDYILLDDKLLELYILADIYNNLYENEEYIISQVPFFDIHELRLTNYQKENINKEDVRLKMLYAYIKQMGKEKRYSISEIGNILDRFDLYDSKIIKILCETHKLDKLLRIWDSLTFRSIYKHIKIFEYDVNCKLQAPSKIGGNFIKLKITSKPYIEGSSLLGFLVKDEEESKKEKYSNTFEYGMQLFEISDRMTSDLSKEDRQKRCSKEIYENQISKELNALGIWNELIEINDKQEYVIAVNLNDFEGIPIDESKLKSIESTQMQDRYIKSKIQELENIIEYCIPTYEENEKKRYFKKQLESEKNMYNKAYYGLLPYPYKTLPLNRINEDIMQYIESLPIMDIFAYGVSRLEKIDLNSDFTENMKELEGINTINKIMKSGYNTNFGAKFYMKKYEIILTQILSLIDNLETANLTEEEIFNKVLYPYCTKEEQDKILPIIKDTIKNMIIPKKIFIVDMGVLLSVAQGNFYRELWLRAERNIFKRKKEDIEKTKEREHMEI